MAFLPYYLARVWIASWASLRYSYSTAVKGAQEYNTKFIEFAQNNTKAAFDFVQELSGVKTVPPSLLARRQWAIDALEREARRTVASVETRWRESGLRIWG